MSILTFWSDKGGTGKSLLTAMAASWKWSTNNPIVVIDLDPQGDSREWAARAGVPWQAPGSPDEAAKVLKSLSQTFMVIVDCPPGRLMDQRMAGVGVLSADALIIPTGSGRPDLNALGRAILALDELSKKGAVIKSGIVLNHYRETTRARTVEEGLRLAKLTFLGRLGERAIFPEAFSEGRNMVEIGGLASIEVCRIFEKIDNWFM